MNLWIQKYSPNFIPSWLNTKNPPDCLYLMKFTTTLPHFLPREKCLSVHNTLQRSCTCVSGSTQLHNEYESIWFLYQKELGSRFRQLHTSVTGQSTGIVVLSLHNIQYFTAIFKCWLLVQGSILPHNCPALSDLEKKGTVSLNKENSGVYFILHNFVCSSIFRMVSTILSSFLKYKYRNRIKISVVLFLCLQFRRKWSGKTFYYQKYDTLYEEMGGLILLRMMTLPYNHCLRDILTY